MAITYDAPSNTITVTGYSELTPCTFQDIKNANDTGVWGVVGKQGTAQFLFACHLELGIAAGAAGWLADTLKLIEFDTGFEFNTRDTGHFRAGIMVDDTNKITKEGCVIIMDFNILNNYLRCYGEFEFYSSTLMNMDRDYGQLLLGPEVDTNKIRFWNSKVTGLGYVREVGDWQEHEYNWFRSNIENNDIGILCSTGVFPVEHLIDTVVMGCNNGIEITWLGYYAEDSATMRNLHLKGMADEDIFIYNSGHNHPWAVYLIDAISDWTFKWTGTYVNGQVNRQYTFNLHVVDEDGANVQTARVRCWDKDESLVFDVNTDVNGVIAEQIISYGNYKPAMAVTLLVAGYTNCIPTDIGKQVIDDTVEIGILHSYDNVTREWIVDTHTVISSGSAMSISDGDGIGTSTGNSLSITHLTMKTPHALKVTKAGYNDLDFVGDITAPIDWTLTLTDPCYPWSIEKINDNAASGYDHSQVANYPMSWNDGGNILTIWGDDGTGGKEAMGYNAAHPITMEEVWAFAAYTKGTCICSKDSDDAFTMKAILFIGNGTAVTYFVSENQSVWQFDYFKVTNHAVMRMGSIATDGSNPYPDPKWGASWTIDRKTNPIAGMPAKCYFVNNGGELYVYDSRIALTDNSKAFDTETGAYTYVGYSTFAGYDRLDATYIRWWGVLEFDHMTLHHCRNMNFPTPPHADSEVLNIYDNQNNLQVKDNESWIYDATLKNAIICACKTLQNGRANLVDPEGFDTAKVCNAQSVCWQKMWHRFAVRVKDKEDNAIVGVNVQVLNNSLVDIYNEDTIGTGWAPMQLIKEWQTKATTGEPLTYPGDFDLEGPFILIITKEGYETYTTKLEISKRMDKEEIRLKRIKLNVDNEAII